MITTRRADNNSMNAFGSDASRGGVALLERREPATYSEYVAPQTTGESVDEARVRMRANLDRLLNVDRYSEQVQSTAVPNIEQIANAETESVQVVEQATTVAEEVQAISEDDIRPTSTTMQFGDGDIENLRMDMKAEQEESQGKYRLNAKGKIVVVLYALVLTVVLTLIAINTGVLAKLSNQEQTAMAQVEENKQLYSRVMEDVESISNSEYISEQAVGLGMKK